MSTCGSFRPLWTLLRHLSIDQVQMVVVVNFIYMTNRATGRWSLLLDSKKGRPILAEASEIISTGYTQLWLFEKRFAFHPQNGKLLSNEREGNKHYDPPYPSEIDRKDWPGRLYVVLREPLELTPYLHDVVTYHVIENDAVQSAQVYAEGQGRRAVVGLLVADLYWH